MAQFESSVNSEGIETISVYILYDLTFESSVNSEGIETERFYGRYDLGLRAV